MKDSKTDIDWKIIYSRYEGPEARAVDFLYREMGSHLLRAPGIYTIYTMSCEKLDTIAGEDKNLLVLGCIGENEILRRFIAEKDVPRDGYAIRVLDNPDCPGRQLVLIAGSTPLATLYGAIDFIDIAIPEMTAELGNGLRFHNRTLREKLPQYQRTSAPETKKRSVFSWGHTINNYREYIENMARLKLNEIMIWNEYPPLNAKEIVDYAHSWGLAIIWGFSWGWTPACRGTDSKTLAGLGNSIMEQWRNVWRPLGGDGIYFQSFTETNQEESNGICIADAAVRLVNETAERIWKEAPGLRLVFGLHATSVRNKLDIIAKTHPDICILWEDCGGFPYRGDVMPEFDSDNAFTKRLLEQDREMGLVFKGQMMMEWGCFAHQAGPYVLGNSSKQTIGNDTSIIEPGWLHLKSLWMQYGEHAYKLASMAHSHPNCSILNITGNLTGKIEWPTALCAQMLWSTREPYQDMLNRIVKMPYININ